MRAVIGVESAIVIIAFVIVACALAFVVLNMNTVSSENHKPYYQYGCEDRHCVADWNNLKKKYENYLNNKKVLESGVGVLLELDFNLGGISSNVETIVDCSLRYNTTSFKILENSCSDYEILLVCLNAESEMKYGEFCEIMYETKLPLPFLKD